VTTTTRIFFLLGHELEHYVLFVRSCCLAAVAVAVAVATKEESTVFEDKKERTKKKKDMSDEDKM